MFQKSTICFPYSILNSYGDVLDSTFSVKPHYDWLLLQIVYMIQETTICSHHLTVNFYMTQVWAGNPAKFLRKLTDEEIAFIAQSATNYCNLARVHAAENSKSFDEIEFEKMLRKKYAKRDEEYDSMIGVVRETPPELVLPDNILPEKAAKSIIQ